MITFAQNALTEKGAVARQAREVLKNSTITLGLANGSSVALDKMPDGSYRGVIATDSEGHTIYGKVEFSVTANEYVEKAPKEKAPVAAPEFIYE